MFEPIDKTFQRDFYSQFQASRAGSRAFDRLTPILCLSDIRPDLIARLDAAKHSPPPDNDWQELALSIRKLRKYLTDATSFLPSYDQRQCQAVRCHKAFMTFQSQFFTQQMDLLEQSLEEKRSTSLPKKKFAFKRKADRSQPALPTLPPSPQATSSQLERDRLSEVSTFHKLNAHVNCRLSLQSLPTFGDDTPTFDMTISDLSRCIVDLCSPATIMSPHYLLPLTSLHIHDLKETILILPNLNGSVLLHNLHTCTVIIACHQASISLSDIGDRSYPLLPVPYAQFNERSRIPCSGL